MLLHFRLSSSRFFHFLPCGQCWFLSLSFNPTYIALTLPSPFALATSSHPSLAFVVPFFVEFCHAFRRLKCHISYCRCQKTVYYSERIQCLDASWHKQCLKCGVCRTTLNLNNYQSFEMKPYCKSHVPTVKATVVSDDVLSQHAKTSQKVASYSRSENITTQKGTGEKPTQTADDALMSHAREAQKAASYARAENVTTQKGTGEMGTSTTDDIMMQHNREVAFPCRCTRFTS